MSVTGDAGGDNAHNEADDTFSQDLSMDPLLTFTGINNYLAGKSPAVTHSSKKDKTVVRSSFNQM